MADDNKEFDELREQFVVYLRDLAERLFRIPVMYGVDQADYERCREIARAIENLVIVED